jgi:hypothetical protein
MPRFVILEHDHPVLHWDLMLETGAVLKTWRLAAPPLAGCTITALYLAEHRRDYLDYEGPVSGGRGRVKRWDRGVYSAREQSHGRLACKLDGARVRGVVELRQVEADQWTFELKAEAT